MNTLVETVTKTTLTTAPRSTFEKVAVDRRALLVNSYGSNVALVLPWGGGDDARVRAIAERVAEYAATLLAEERERHGHELREAAEAARLARKAQKAAA